MWWLTTPSPFHRKGLLRVRQSGHPLPPSEPHGSGGEQRCELLIAFSLGSVHCFPHTVASQVIVEMDKKTSLVMLHNPKADESEPPKQVPIIARLTEGSNPDPP